MKKFILCISILALGFSAAAQDFTWGAKISASSPNLKIDDIKNIENADETIQLLENTDASLGYQLGLFARVSVLGIYVPEVMLSNSKSEIKFTDVMDENQELVDVIGEVKLNKLDVPVMVGKRFLKILRLNAGPVFTLLLSQDVDQSGISDAYEEIEANYKNSTVGLQYGIGLDLAALTIDLRHEMGLQSISDDITIGETTFEADQRMDQFLLSVGIKF